MLLRLLFFFKTGVTMVEAMTVTGEVVESAYDVECSAEVAKALDTAS